MFFKITMNKVEGQTTEVGKILVINEYQSVNFLNASGINTNWQEKCQYSKRQDTKVMRSEKVNIT